MNQRLLSRAAVAAACVAVLTLAACDRKGGTPPQPETSTTPPPVSTSPPSTGSMSPTPPASAPDPAASKP